MNETPQLDSFGRDYLRLVLGIDRHLDGYIDAYYGPPELKAEVASAPRPEPAALLAEVQRLQGGIPAADANRAAYLAGMLRAVECAVRQLNGETFDYADEVRLLYDTPPVVVNESEFEAAHRALDEVLPEAAGASLAERLERWRKQFTVGNDGALALIDLARDETRRRTAAFIDLPADESLEVRLTHDQPWSAYNWYLGHGRSLIEFNTDLPLQAAHLIGTFAHEGYPGHHTEHILKEAAIYRGKGYAEQSTMLLNSPMAVIAEGIATSALGMIFPDHDQHEWTADVILPAARLDLGPDIARQMRRVEEALRPLRHVSGNAAFLFHTGRLDYVEAIDYARQYGLMSQKRAEQVLRFCTHPLFRTYSFTYTLGYDLIAETADPRQTFRRLLTEQALPSQLAAERPRPESL